MQKNFFKLPKWVCIISVLGILFRGYLLIEFTPPCCGSDEGVYNSLAKNIVQQGEFVITKTDDRTQWAEKVYGAKPPLYPFFLAIVYKIIGINHTAVKVIQIFVSATVGLLIYQIAKKIFSEKVGLISLVVYTFFWETAFMSLNLLSENLYWLFLGLLVYLLIRTEKITIVVTALTGITVGLMTLDRATSIGIILPIFVWLILKSFKLRVCLTVMVIIFFAGLTTFPWILRNYNVYHQFVPVYTDGGINFWMGNYPNSGGSYNIPKKDDQLQTPKLKTSGPAGEIERDNFYYNQTMSYIKDNPIAAFDIAWRKVFLTFTLRRGYVENQVALKGKWFLARPQSFGLNAFLEFLVYYEFAALCLFSFLAVIKIILMERRQDNPAILLVLLISWHLLSIAMSHYEPRYITQLYPLMIPLAGFMILPIISRWQ